MPASMAKMALDLLQKHGDEYALDGELPSVQHYLGVAMYNLGLLQEAADAFLSAVQLHDRDLHSWLHLGDCLLHRFRVKEACWAFESAIIAKNLTGDVSKLYKARAWIADW